MRPSARSSRAPSSNTRNRSSRIWTCFGFSLIILTNESNQSRKHTSKASPPRSAQSGQLSGELSAPFAVWKMRLTAAAALIFHTQIYGQHHEQGSWILQTCYESTRLLFICKYDIGDPVEQCFLTDDGRGCIYVRDQSGHFFFIYNAPNLPVWIFITV